MKLGIEKTKHAMRWQKRLCEDFGEEKGRDILEKADDIFEKLCSGNGSDTRELKEHTEKVIYPVMALYKTLCEYCDSQGNALNFTAKYFFESVDMQAKTLRSFINAGKSAESFPGVFIRQMTKDYSEKAGFRMKIITDEKSNARFDILECPYEKTTKKYNCMELCDLFCKSDEMCYSGISPELHWKREHTLAKDNDYCDFSLEYKENDK